MAPIVDDVLATGGTAPRRWLLAATLAAGLLAALAVDADSVTGVSGPTQSSLSVLLPVVAILVVQDRVRRGAGVRRLVVVAVALVCLAVSVALAGVVIAGVRVAAVGGSWTGVSGLVAGSVEVQIVTVLVGAGFGLLTRSAALAIFLDIAVPLGLFALLGALGWTALRAWTTPYAVVRDLLDGAAEPVTWVRAAAVFLLWVVLLGGAGVVRATRTAGRR